MDMAELFLEAARVQGSIAKINTTLAFVVDPARRVKPDKALAAHTRALHNLAAELAARYVSSSADRRAVLFKLMGAVALASRAYLEEFDSEKDTFYEQEFLRDQMREALAELELLK